MIGIVMFVAALAMLTIGYPVAFTFGSVAVFFGFFSAIVELGSNATLVSMYEEFS